MERTIKRLDLLPGTLDMLILKTLERSHEPMHGYGIAQHIKQVSREVLRVEEGSLYPALQRLMIKGWVKTEWGQSENNRRARYYRLTRSGHKQLTREMADFDLVLEGIMRILQQA